MKRRWIALLLALLCMVCVVSPAAQSEAIDLETFYVHFSGDCNMRTDPNLEGQIMDVVPKGDEAPFCAGAEVDERDVRWYLIAYGDDIGWVSSKYAVLTNGTLEPVYYQAQWEYSAYYQVQKRCYLMAEPSYDAQILDALFPEDYASNLGYYYFDADGNGWNYVIYGDQAGWIPAYLSVGVMEDGE